MAPERHRVDGSVVSELRLADDQMKAISQNLYNLMVQAYDHQGSSTENAMRQQIQQLVQGLMALRDLAPSVTAQIPPELIEYVDSGRNPDIYTRQFVEVVMENNQKLKGKSEAFGAFRDVLATEMIRSIDGVEEDVKRVMERSRCQSD